MTTLSRRIIWVAVSLLSVFSAVVVVDASSKSNTMPSSVPTREPTTNRSDGTRKKTRGGGSGKRSSSSSAGGGESVSLRRIKKEYKDAVEMGIAYDWVNQRLITRKTKAKANPKDPDDKINRINRKKQQANNILCLGPIQTNLRQWHFSFRGAGESVYSGGIYHGQIVLPKDYPLSPPSVQVWTPSGRFIPHTDICLSASNYHPEAWTPRWSIHGIVNALRLHMLQRAHEIGGMESPPEKMKEYARASLEWKATWTVRGGSGGKRKRTTITVDHRLLVREGVLGANPTSSICEEEDVTTGKDSSGGMEVSSSHSTTADSMSNRERKAAAKPNKDTAPVNCRTENERSRAGRCAKSRVRDEAVSSMIQLMILNYMVVQKHCNI